jgi:nucleoid DNA-binding protein
MRRCQGAAAQVSVVRHADRPHARNGLRYAVVVSARGGHCRSRRDCTKTYDNQHRRSSVYHRDVIAEAARRLPHRTRRDVSEIVEVLAELWFEELASGGEVVLPDIGRLRMEVQAMAAGGALAAHGRLRRVYGRFRPATKLKAQIGEVDVA